MDAIQYDTFIFNSSKAQPVHAEVNENKTIELVPPSAKNETPIEVFEGIFYINIYTLRKMDIYMCICFSINKIMNI